MVPVSHVVELGSNTQPVARLAHAALQNRADVQLAADLADILLFVLKRERRAARGHVKAAHARQGVNDLLGHAVAEVFLVLGFTQVHERQDCDGGNLCDWRGTPGLNQPPKAAPQPAARGPAAGSMRDGVTRPEPKRPAPLREPEARRPGRNRLWARRCVPDRYGLRSRSTP